MPIECHTVTDIRRRILMRLHEAGRPLTREEALDQRPGVANSIPALCRIGWVVASYGGPTIAYEITAGGRSALGLD